MGTFNSHILLQEIEMILEELAHWEIQIKAEMIEFSFLAKNKFIQEKEKSLHRFPEKGVMQVYN